MRFIIIIIASWSYRGLVRKISDNRLPPFFMTRLGKLLILRVINILRLITGAFLATTIIKRPSEIKSAMEMTW